VRGFGEPFDEKVNKEKKGNGVDNKGMHRASLYIRCCLVISYLYICGLPSSFHPLIFACYNITNSTVWIKIYIIN